MSATVTFANGTTYKLLNIISNTQNMEGKLNIKAIVSELKTERTRIDRALSALEDLSPNGAASVVRSRRAGGTRKRGHLTAAGRNRLSELMKKRWAERRQKIARKK